MVSISKQNKQNILKMFFFSSIVFIIYKLGIAAYNYKTFEDKKRVLENKISKELKYKKNLDNLYKNNEIKLKVLKTSYIEEEQLEKKLIKIFNRFSISSYKIKYLGIQKTCIDKHIIALKINTKNEKQKNIALKIIKTLGEIKKTNEDSNLYFVEYISRAKK